MSKKKKKEKEYAPIYVQSSNPSTQILNWMQSMAEDGILVYFQSGKPGGTPPCGGPHQPPC